VVFDIIVCVRFCMQAQVRVASKYVGRSGNLLPDTLDTVCCVNSLGLANLEEPSYGSKERALYEYCGIAASPSGR